MAPFGLQGFALVVDAVFGQCRRRKCKTVDVLLLKTRC